MTSFKTNKMLTSGTLGGLCTFGDLKTEIWDKRFRI